MQRVAVAVGVANQRSLAWKSALAMLQGEFDHVIVTYQNERFQASVDKMVQQQNAIYFNQYQQFQQHGQLDELLVPLKRISSLPLDISQEEEVQTLFQERIPSLLQSFNDTNTDIDHPMDMDMDMDPQLDAVVHSVAYAPPSAMKSSQELPLLHTDKDSFQTSHSLSSYSLITLARHALPLLSCQNDTHDKDNHNDGHQRRSRSPSRSPSITTMTYLGSTRSVPNYNIMGPAKASLESLVRGIAMELSKPPHNIRVNAISAGPINTLAARGIKDFNVLKNEMEEKSMIQRGIGGDEVGDVVAFVAGKKASGVTGQVWFVDGGYSSLG